MRAAIAATLFFIVIAIISGTLTFPSQEDLILILSSMILLIVSWFYVKEKRSDKEDNKSTKK